ncbi:BREX-1 system adenine-specific DNA-methyltransferase PglX [Tessaracoccus sp. Y1736]
METAPLKSFATWARKELIREVTARIAVVLAPASAEGVEQPRAVEALEKAVAGAGGGDTGKAAVAEKVAYTWFNRIVALRFMDANGYSSVGVVSPQAGVETGQPEILAEAKRGNFESEVVGNKTRETVTGLLNGSRRSVDAQGEAYALMLAEYCRHWNRAMPFMFEREGDFTELLIPGNLLADDSVPSRADRVLTRDVCSDVEVIGWLYQFYISERKDEVFAGFNKNKKAGADEIPAATQLFTPHWIVRYLVENSLGRLWMLNRPASHLVDQMDYYIAPVDEETDFLKVSRPEELKVVDPACGSGHMLTYAFDLLYAIYEEEGYAPADIPSLILSNNLYGIEIDPRAGALAAFALTMKARAKQRTFFIRQVEPNVCVLDPIRFTLEEIDFLLTRSGDMHAEAAFWNQFEHADTFGSLIQPDLGLVHGLKRHLFELDDGGDMIWADVRQRADRVVLQAEYLTQRYAIAIANPPYMGGGNMGPSLAQFGKANYAASWSDLFAMFIERSLALVERDGRVAMITMQSWMYLTSFEKLRSRLLSASSIDSLVHLGAGAFSTIGGSVVSTCAFILHAGRVTEHAGLYVDLTNSPGEAGKESGLRSSLSVGAGRTFLVSSPRFQLVPGAPIAYDLEERQVFTRQNLGERFRSAGRLKTHDNARYVRSWWEVDAKDTKWRFLHNGGSRSAFYGNDEEVADWSASAQRNYSGHGGMPKQEAMSRQGITWTLIGSAAGSFRHRGADDLFSSGSPTIVCDNNEESWSYLAALNSTAAARLLQAINPTMNTVVGNILSLPTLRSNSLEQLAPLATACYQLSVERYRGRETSPRFVACTALLHDPGEATLSTVAMRERERATGRGDAMTTFLREIDAIVGADWGVVCPARKAFATPKIVEWNEELARDLVSYALGCMFGRYSLDEPGLLLAEHGATVQDYLAKVPSPTFAPDKDNVIPIVDGDWFEDDVVARFRTFLRLAFGEQHFEENLRFVTESLGVKDIRDYFVRSFYKDHVQRYRKRPIYWLFSSPKGSFNALIYMHRYTPSTVSTVLNEYLREFTAKLSSSLQQQERLAAGGGTPRQQATAQKEADRLRKVLLELEEYEHDVLYPLASRQLAIDLDDGVKANYPKFGAALKRIPGLEASDE